MKGLSALERRALVVDPSAVGEWIPGHVFDDLIARGLARWKRRGWWPFAGTYFAPTDLGQKLLALSEGDP